MDFRKAKSLGGSIPDTAGAEFCGTGNENLLSEGSVVDHRISRLCWLRPIAGFMQTAPKQDQYSLSGAPNLASGVYRACTDSAEPTDRCSRLDITTDQPALQIYTCNGFDGTIPRKREQGGPNSTYGQHSCLVIEQESYIDAINNPEFGIDQIYGPNRTYEWEAEYKFSVVR
ncbi:hypothetical protein MPER_08278 [Moniliophthora perniciosa FA553]|nr:hypothetical protein MPER_08278 [Moniliophthora perniciosa FA553]